MKSERCENRAKDRSRERGTATLTAVMIMGLLALFTAASLSRVTTEAMVMGNDYAHTQAFYASQASLELMSRNFNKVFDVQLRPTAADIARIENDTPNIDGFTFNQLVTQMASSSSHPIEDGPFSGLISLRTPWRLQAIATYANGAQVQLTRTFFNHQIPIFQFGIFYNDDMEIYPGPNFNFGGRVHSNGHLFLAAGSNLYFRSRVTAHGEIVRDISRSGKTLADGDWTGKVWVADAANVFRELLVGEASVLGGPDTVPDNPNMPDGAPNANWSQDLKLFSGNLLARQPELRLPLQIGTDEDPIEIIKRGKPSDNALLRDSRFFNNPGIRVSLSDSQARLPGGTGGVRLDGVYGGVAGYLPPAMNGGLYQATRFNPHRIYTATSYDNNPRETWIKVELVTRNAATLTPEAVDITADILSLGFTEAAPQLGFPSNSSPTTTNPQNDRGADNRAIIKLQRYVIPGPPIKVAAG
ncbi:MAG TPA: hypothetical protein VNO14_08835, partial [Blastocatellia bacterium]|nr:hypothetical protein [Blastocatellia bacterium]